MGVAIGLIYPLDSEKMAGQVFAFPPPRESGFVTVATDSGGNYFLIELSTGEVFFHDHEELDVVFVRDDLRWLAPSLGSLVDALEPMPGELTEEPDEIETFGERGQPDEVERFVRSRGLDAKNRLGRTLAQEAARQKNLPVVKECVRLGASTEGLLHLAASGKNLELLEFLLSLGLPINGLDERATTPLDCAMYQSTYDYLVSKGAVHKRGKRLPVLL